MTPEQRSAAAVKADVLVVTNDAGNSFNVVAGTPDAKYGPLVVIYDADYADDPRFPELGQRVADYYLDTLAGARGGVAMYGSESKWVLSATNVAAIVAHFS